MSRRRTKKLVLKTEFLREEFLEVQEIHDIARQDFFDKIRKIQLDLNVFDDALDKGYASNSSAGRGPEASEEIDSETNDEERHTPEEIDKAQTNHPAWAKALYRKITIKTHPDKLIGVDDELKKERTAQYRAASKAYASSDYCDLVMIAVDLKLALPSGEEVEKILNDKCSSYSKDTKELKSTIFWTWHQTDESQKNQILSDFIKLRGWTNPGTAIKKSRPERGPGKSIAWIRKKLLEEDDV